MSVTKKVTQNFAAVIIARVAFTIVPVATVPLLLRSWGSKDFGTWIVLSAVPAWLSMADLGFGSVAANEISIRFSAGDIAGARRCLHSAWTVVVALSLIGAIILMPLCYLLPWVNWLGIDAKFGHTNQIALSLLIINVLISLYGGVIYAIYRASGRAAIGSLVPTVRPVMEFVLLWLTVSRGASFAVAAAAMLTAQCINLYVNAHVAYKVCPELRLGFQCFSPTDFRYCLRKGAAYSLFPLGNAILQQGTIFAVNAALGSAAVVVFGTVRTLSRSASQIMTLINNSVWPELSTLIGQRRWDAVRRIHRFAVQLSVVSALVLVGAVVTIGPEIYRLWTTGILSVDRTVLVAFSVAIATNSIWFTSSVVLAAANRHEMLAIIFVLASAACLPICYVAAKEIGIAGAALSTVVVDLALIPYVLTATLRFTSDKFSNLLRWNLRFPKFKHS
jgi:O-antigen/teichoic acid export membrane protein